ncbi:hypothetical protein C8F04DRAFT_1291553 [Mycena alexandri]|uniref:Uncharacterized protein n=1 Tax=Mycena alexandri TaxID=1745969 RepID=A0AAD6SJL6_9AGAR|nr:hypothetical protein C8F04DRAFT_1291553 [Mycena alexandri]
MQLNFVQHSFFWTGLQPQLYSNHVSKVQTFGESSFYLFVSTHTMLRHSILFPFTYLHRSPYWHSAPQLNPIELKPIPQRVPGPNFAALRSIFPECSFSWVFQSSNHSNPQAHQASFPSIQFNSMEPAHNLANENLANENSTTRIPQIQKLRREEYAACMGTNQSAQDSARALQELQQGSCVRGDSTHTASARAPSLRRVRRANGTWYLVPAALDSGAGAGSVAPPYGSAPSVRRGIRCGKHAQEHEERTPRVGVGAEAMSLKQIGRCERAGACRRVSMRARGSVRGSTGRKEKKGSARQGMHERGPNARAYAMPTPRMMLVITLAAQDSGVGCHLLRRRRLDAQCMPCGDTPTESAQTGDLGTAPADSNGGCTRGRRRRRRWGRRGRWYEGGEEDVIEEEKRESRSVHHAAKFNDDPQTRSQLDSNCDSSTLTSTAFRPQVDAACIYVGRRWGRHTFDTRGSTFTYMQPTL